MSFSRLAFLVALFAFSTVVRAGTIPYNVSPSSTVQVGQQYTVTVYASTGSNESAVYINLTRGGASEASGTTSATYTCPGEAAGTASVTYTATAGFMNNTTHAVTPVTQTIVITVQANPPTIAWDPITPASATWGQYFTVKAIGQDVDGDLVTVNIYRDMNDGNGYQPFAFGFDDTGDGTPRGKKAGSQNPTLTPSQITTINFKAEAIDAAGHHSQMIYCSVAAYSPNAPVLQAAQLSNPYIFQDTNIIMSAYDPDSDLSGIYITDRLQQPDGSYVANKTAPSPGVYALSLSAPDGKNPGPDVQWVYYNNNATDWSNHGTWNFSGGFTTQNHDVDPPTIVPINRTLAPGETIWLTTAQHDADGNLLNHAIYYHVWNAATGTYGDWIAITAALTYPNGTYDTGYNFQWTPPGPGQYEVMVQGNDIGNPKSATITVQEMAPDTTAPLAPVLAAGTPTTMAIPLSWTEPGPSDPTLTGYTLTWGPVAGAQSNVTLGSNTTGYTVSLLNAGTSYSFVLYAFDGAGNVSQPSNSLTITTAKFSQTVTFPGIPAHVYGDTFDPAAYSSSGLPVTYTTNGIGSVSGTNPNLITAIGLGTMTITGSQVGSTSYLPASASASVTITKAPSGLAFMLGAHTYTDAPFNISPTTKSNGAITYTSGTPGVATIDSTGLITIHGAGSTSITVAQAEGTYWLAGNVQQTLIVSKTSPTLIFAPAASYPTGTAIKLSATSNSPEPIVFSVGNGSPAIMADATTLQLTNTGTVTVTASQVADANFNTASVIKTISSTAAAVPKVVLDKASPIAMTTGQVLKVTASGGGPGGYTWGGNATTSGNTASGVKSLTFASAGTYTLTVVSPALYGVPVSNTLSVTVNVTNCVPTYHLDSGPTKTGTVVAGSGWAFDPLDGVPVSVQLLIDGFVRKDALTYGSSRTDVQAASASNGWSHADVTNCGYSYSFDTSVLPTGTHTLSLRVTNSHGLSVTPTLGTVTSTNAAATDTDANGLPDSWEKRHFSVTTGTDPLADPDKDGLNNAAEFNSGSDPKVADKTAAQQGGTLPTNWPTTSADVVGKTPGTFAVNPSGAATYSIPLAVSPGTAGMQPSLSLDYSSQSGNGLLGVGWKLKGLSVITRGGPTMASDGTAGPVTFGATDKFYIDGQRLIAISGAYGADSTEYRTEIDSFVKVVSYGTSGAGPQYFKVWTKAGLILELGNTTDSRLLRNGTQDVISWGLNKTSDRFGNSLTVTYTQNVVANTTREFYPSQIQYTCNAAFPTGYASVNFSYEDRTDKSTGYLVGSILTQNVRLNEVVAKYGTQVYRDYVLKYQDGVNGDPSRLTSVQEQTSSTTMLPKTGFTYQDRGTTGFTVGTTQTLAGTGYSFRDRFLPCDLDGDGKTDLIRIDDRTAGANFTMSAQYYRNNGTSFDQQTEVQVTTQTTVLSHPASFVTTNMRGDGRSSLVVFNTPLKVVELSATGPQLVARDLPTLTNLQSPDLVFRGDLNHDGLEDLIACYYLSGKVYFKVLLSTGSSYTLVSDSTGKTLGNVHNDFHELDIDGDGVPEIVRIDDDGTNDFMVVYKWNGSGFTESPHQTLGKHHATDVYYELDINGDGMTDLLCDSDAGGGNATATLWLSDGTKLINSGSQAFGGWNAIFRFVPVDYNGDAKTDLAEIWKGPDGKTQLGVWISNGKGFVSQPSTAIYDTWEATALVFPSQLDSEARTDLLFTTTAQTPTNNVYPNYIRQIVSNGFNPNLLAQIRDGFGNTTTINYQSLLSGSIYHKLSGAVYPEFDIATAANVVSSVGLPDEAGGSYTEVYSYTGLRANATRGLEGFASIDVNDSRTNITKTTMFWQGFPYTGMVAQTVLTAERPATPVAISATTNEKTTDTISTATPLNGEPRVRYFPHIGKSTTVNKDLDGSAVSTVVNQYTYDSFGNLTQSVQKSYDGAPSDLTTAPNYNLTTATTFSNTSATWLIGQATQVVTSASSPSYTTAINRTTNYTYRANTNAIETKTVEPSNSALTLKTTLDYDTYGNVKQSTVTQAGLADRITKADYSATGANPEAGRFLHQTTNPAAETTTYTFDTLLGVPLSKTQDGDALTTSWTYDTFGQVVTEIEPDLTVKKMIRRWDASSVTYLGTTVNALGCYSIETQATGAAPKLAIYNAMGHPIRSQTINSDGNEILSDTQYDGSGNALQVSRPYISGAKSYWIQTAYDDLGRPTSIKKPYQDSTPTGTNEPTYATTSYSYTGLSSSQTNARGYIDKTTKNSAGWIVEVVRNTAAAASAADRSDIAFTQDGFGNTRTVTQAGGGTITVGFDTLGRKTSLSDPDMGSWSYAYFPDGSAKTQTDANNKVTSYTYDVLGRLSTKTEGTRVSTWTYVPSGTAGTDQPQLVVVKDGTTELYREAWDYDASGRPKTDTRTIDGTAYSFVQNYDSSGRPSVLNYPSSFSTINVYNAQGFLKEVRKYDTTYTNNQGQLYWQGVAADADQHYVTAILGNGLEDDWVYNPCDGRPVGTATTSAAYIDIPLRVSSFHFDALGDLDSRGLTYTPTGGTSSSYTESFTYDGLNRVLTASLGSTKTMDVAYAANGNIQSKTGVGAYTYDAVHLHAVKTANGVTYSYDAAGNMTASTAGLATTWTQFNQPLKIQKGTSYSQFEYGASEERVTETTEKGKTVYVGALYEWTNVSGAAEDRYYIMTPTGRTAVVSRKASVLSTTYFHADHLGSIDLETDQLGRVVQRYSYDAWGAPRAANWATGVIVPTHPASTRGFSDHEMLDGLGLIHMNGRVYDPVLGRFLRADPNIPHPEDSQSYNRYSYVDNNPLSLVDPTGYDGEDITYDSDPYAGQDLGGFDSGLQSFSDYGSVGSSFTIGYGGIDVSSLSAASGFALLQGNVSDVSWSPGAVNSTSLSQNFNLPTTIDIARKFANDSALAPSTANSATKTQDVPLEWLRRLSGTPAGREFVEEMASGTYNVYLASHADIQGFGATPSVHGVQTNDIFVDEAIDPAVIRYFAKHYGFTGDEVDFQLDTAGHERGHILNHRSSTPYTGNDDEAFARQAGDRFAVSIGGSPLYPVFNDNFADYQGVVQWDLAHRSAGSNSTATQYRGASMNDTAYDRLKSRATLLTGWDFRRLEN